MKNWAKMLLAVAATAVITPQLVLADNYRGWHNGGHSYGGWGRSYGGRGYGYRNIYSNGVVYPNNYGYSGWNPYRHGVRTWNGSWVDGTIGPDGYPAWAGGYRPGYHH